jgi:hypothetical protein
LINLLAGVNATGASTPALGKPKIRHLKALHRKASANCDLIGDS